MKTMRAISKVGLVAKTTWISALTLVLLATLCFGQVTSSSIMGTVTDPSGAPVAGVKLELRDEGTGAVRTTETTPEGIFRFNSILAAQYTLKVEAQGFKTQTQAGISRGFQRNA
jgi:hypothetical protein